MPLLDAVLRCCKRLRSPKYLDGTSPGNDKGVIERAGPGAFARRSGRRVLEEKTKAEITLLMASLALSCEISK